MLESNFRPVSWRNVTPPPGRFWGWKGGISWVLHVFKVQSKWEAFRARWPYWWVKQSKQKWRNSKRCRFIFCYNGFVFPSERLFLGSRQKSVMVFFKNGKRERWDNWFWNDCSSFHGKVVFVSNHVNLISFELSLLGGANKDVLLYLILKCCNQWGAEVEP